jgi:uncharacterized protein
MGLPFKIILQGTVGSTSHGLGIEGQDDRDEMGVCLETFREAIGLKTPFETYVFRTAEQRTGKHDARSEPGDLDLTVHSLRKFLRLALKGNPSVLVPLFLKDEFLQVKTKEGQELQQLAPSIVSKRALGAFLGYLIAQEEKLKGERGTRVHRPELVAKYGYDTKFAMHALRLGHQGCELAETGRLTLPMSGPTLNELRDVRTGKYGLEWVLDNITLLKERLTAFQTTSVLSNEPDIDEVEGWMLWTYRHSWRDQ